MKEDMSISQEKRTRIKWFAATIVFAPTLAALVALTFLFGPTLEEALFPIIDPRTDRVENIRRVGDELCWESVFFKKRDAAPVQVFRTLKIGLPDGESNYYLGVEARRISEPADPNAPFITLPSGEQQITRCFKIPLRDFTWLELTSQWTYIAHSFWKTPQERATVYFARPK